MIGMKKKKDEDFSIDENCHRVIVDVQKREVLKSDRSSEPLAKILEFLLKKEEPKVPWYKKIKVWKSYRNIDWFKYFSFSSLSYCSDCFRCWILQKYSRDESQNSILDGC